MSYNFSTTTNSNSNFSHNATFNSTSDNINDAPTLNNNSAMSLFWDVKSALERNYECLGILCKDVGEITYDTIFAGDRMFDEGSAKSRCYLLSLKSSQEAPSRAPVSDPSIRSSAPTRKKNRTIGVLMLLLLVVGVIVHSIL